MGNVVQNLNLFIYIFIYFENHNILLEPLIYVDKIIQWKDIILHNKFEYFLMRENY